MSHCPSLGIPMQIDPARSALWRVRAEHYRIRAAVSASPGAQLAYSVLADCAESIADRFAQGEFGNRAQAVVESDRPERPATD